MRSVRVALAVALVVVGAACSSHVHKAARTAAPRAPVVTTPPTTRPPPAVVDVAASQEPWKLSAAVSRPVVLPDGGGFLVLGGLATGDPSTSRIVDVDPASGESRITGHLALAVHDSAG